jgi:hypothetical protein
VGLARAAGYDGGMAEKQRKYPVTEWVDPWKPPAPLSRWRRVLSTALFWFCGLTIVYWSWHPEWTPVWLSALLAGLTVRHYTR